MRQAVNELMELRPDGIQLTPGNYPDAGFKEWFLAQKIPYKLHHGFDWHKRRREVWVGKECRALPGATVHPPKRVTQGPLPSHLLESSHTLETMYPGYYLGDFADLDLLIKHERPLAVDVSHLFLYERKTAACRSVATYPNIEEIHISQSYRQRDAHKPICENTFGLRWAVEHAAPIVLECYMHKLNKKQRLEQIGLLRNG